MTVQYKQFRIGDLFDIHPTNAYKLSNANIFAEVGTVPVLSNSSANNGISGYSSLAPTEDGNIITFSDTTTGPDTMFYQDGPFIGYPHVQGMYPVDKGLKKAMSERVALYLIGAMRRACDGMWSYATKFTRKIVANTYISLPVVKRLVPDWQTLSAIFGGGVPI